MILNNIIIGLDKKGSKLMCGDICTYKYRRPTGETISSRGIIIYDEDSYSFAFEQLDDNFPIILMYHVERDSINKVYNVMDIDADVPNADKWVEIYNSNLLSAHLDWCEITLCFILFIQKVVDR